MSRKIKYIYSDYLIQQADKNPAVKGRASLTHNLLLSYGLLTHMERIRPLVCNTADLRAYHLRDYIKQLEVYESKLEKLENARDKNLAPELEEEEEDVIDCSFLSDCHGLSYDCPPWPGIKQYVCTIAGATMTACDCLCKSTDKTEVVINWCGGWHHAQRDKAAGFCYINDIVLGILVLTKKFRRILYIDLDNHHGDGVEMAFANSKRVFCLSFHQLECGYYPGTGKAEDRGGDRALGYSANFPFKSGITGDKYVKYFKRICSNIFNLYQPNVVIVQCGADVIVGDPLGGTNLIPEDLIECMQYILSYELPSLILGGGGYNFPNSSRFWCSLTAAICDVTLNEDISADNENFLEYGPDYCLTIKREKFLKDLNTEEYLEKQCRIIEDNLKYYKVHAV
ncbi:histone deacetylase 8-like [Lucilia sericata]|uniref:histone deacetylase 8-like n=1 Tax=Lucilia sericata TaxID=13632 RepID=UPI0018A84FAF|nr:histone deacetylase 8-like [Lucilia sericata]